MIPRRTGDITSTNCAVVMREAQRYHGGEWTDLVTTCCKRLVLELHDSLKDSDPLEVNQGMIRIQITFVPRSREQE